MQIMPQVIKGDDDEKKPKKKKKKTPSKDLEDGESEEEEEQDDDESIIEPSLRSGTRKNSRQPSPSIDEDLYDLKSLEEIVNEGDDFMGFKKRQGNLSQMNFSSPTGFMGYKNPRFDKTAFLNKKQHQIAQAETDFEKLQLSSDIAAKLRSPRQCRLLSWLRPSYTTTTTITTTSNDPTMMMTHTQGDAYNSMCPFTVDELQKMILESQGKIKNSTTTTTDLQKLAVSSVMNQHQKLVSAVAGNVLSSSTTQNPFIYEIISLPPEPTLPSYHVIQDQTIPPSKSTIAPYTIYTRPKNKHPKPSTTIYGETLDSDLQSSHDISFTLPFPNKSKTKVPVSAEKNTNILAVVQPQAYQYQPYLQNDDPPKQYRPGDDYSVYGNFYLNSEGPTIRPPPTTTTTKPTTPKTTLKPKTTTPKNKESTSDEQDEEEENDDESSEKSGEETQYQNDKVESKQIQSSHHSSKLIFRIPDKIRFSIPSLHGIVGSFRKNVNQPFSSQFLDPTNSQFQDEDSQINSKIKRGHKRQTDEKFLSLKSGLDYEETIKDQFIPDHVHVPSQANIYRNPPPLPPSKSDETTDDAAEDNTTSEEEEDDEETQNDDNSELETNVDDSDENSDRKDNIPKKDQSDQTQQSNKNQQVKTTKAPFFRRPTFPIHLPIFSRSKPEQQTAQPENLNNKNSNNKKTPTQLPSIKQKKENTKNNSTSSNNGILGKFLSPHGMRTLSTITSMFYPPKPDEIHTHDESRPPPGPPPKRPKNNKRPPPRRKRPEKPQDDESGSRESEEEEDDEEDDDEKELKTKKKQVTTTPMPLHPLRIPPKIVAVPIYLEGKETWENAKENFEEEFFDEKTEKRRPSNSKPEKYDYDDESRETSKESTNTGEGVDFGPGQNLQTHYSDIVNGVTKPGITNGNDNRYVLGLPTTWEEIYKDLKKQNKNKQEASESEEESAEEDDPRRDGHRRPPQYHNSRPPPNYHHPHHHMLEPID